MYNNPYMQNYMPNMMQTPVRQEIVKVSGENGAKAYQMAPNSSVLLLDESSPLVWLKTTDGAGYPSLTPYSITPYQPEPPVDMKSLESRIARLEESINAKSYTSSNDRKQNEQHNANAKGN